MEENNLTPVVIKQVPSVINWNYDVIKNTLSSFLEKYEGYLVTEESLTEDKKVRAELNKISKNIDEFRKTVKKEVSKPIDIFEDQCKELSGMVIDVSTKIDKTVKEFEDEKREQRRKSAMFVIEELTLSSGLPKEYTDRIEFKDSFTNLTSTRKAVMEDVAFQIGILKKEYEQFLENSKTISIAVEEANKNISTKLFEDDYLNQLKYKTVSDIITLINDRVASIKKQEEAKPEVKIEIPKVEVKIEEETRSIILEITGTDTQLKALRNFLDTNNFNYKKI